MCAIAVDRAYRQAIQAMTRDGDYQDRLALKKLFFRMFEPCIHTPVHLRTLLPPDENNDWVREFMSPEYFLLSVNATATFYITK